MRRRHLRTTGAGKSYAVAKEVGSLSSWRRIDADDFKFRLIEHLVDREISDYAPTLSRVLRDGKPVMPMELAALVHTESAYLAQLALGLTLARGEDVIVEGTLSWEPLVAQYSNELAIAGYEDLTVIDLTTPRPVALERAKSRWWEGRLQEGLGGRFTMPSAIDRMYDETGVGDA